MLTNHQVSEFTGKVHRVVEGQSYVSTRQLVDSDEKQQILEGLLEFSKPAYLRDTEDFHYLLKTPFRYPPLEYGSRFGKKSESGIFYASLELDTAFTEAAYYRFRFILDTEAELTSGFVDYTSLFATINTTQLLDLTKAGEENIKKISDPYSYKYSQSIGSSARDSKIESILFFSARATMNKNIAILSPKAISNKKLKERDLEHWKCYIDSEQVSFSNQMNRKYHFALEDFLINREFPIAR